MPNSEPREHADLLTPTVLVGVGEKTSLFPVQLLPQDRKDGKAEEEGTALCLSGGGYRAMLFHAGAIWRLNELGILPNLNRVSSVSGGSIAAATLGVKWSALRFNNLTASNFVQEVVAPVRRLASQTIDIVSVLRAIFWPGSVSDQIAAAYRKYLFSGATLQDLPDTPRFVINASNVQSKSLWRFSKPYMRDWRVGEVRNPKLELAIAVAASSAFPPFLSPLELDLNESDFTPNSGEGLQRPPFTTQVILTDGGVYDNLGLETAWKRFSRILVSDGGGLLGSEEDPDRDWLNHTRRVFDLVDNQVRSLRKRQLMDSFDNNLREGCYWGIWTDIGRYNTPNSLPCPYARTQQLASLPTRLKGMDSDKQERLINWGYAVCDAAIRRFVKPSAPPPTGFPYPRGV